ncbi:Hypothetical predicted protein, partial [Paramuricea clavata]
MLAVVESSSEITEPQREVISIYKDDFTTPPSRPQYFIEVYRCVKLEVGECSSSGPSTYPVPKTTNEIEIVVPDITNKDSDSSDKKKFYKYVVHNHTSCQCGNLKYRNGRLYKTIAIYNNEVVKNETPNKQTDMLSGSSKNVLLTNDISCKSYDGAKTQQQGQNHPQKLKRSSSEPPVGNSCDQEPNYEILVYIASGKVILAAFLLSLVLFTILIMDFTLCRRKKGFLYALLGCKSDDADHVCQRCSERNRKCIERHAPLRRTKITRPPAPWLKDPTIQDLQEQRNVLQASARRSKDAQAWELFRSARNRLKALIKTAKKKFTQKMLSSKKPKEVWKVIHRILHPEPRRITFHPDKLNSHFTSTAERTIGTDVNDNNNSYDTIRNMIDSLPPDYDNGFHINPVTLGEVVNEIRCLRGDCSTGPDHIPAKMIKIVAEYLGSPLTDIINTCIANRSFPSAWKIARICAIPKVKQITSENDLRPISILPVLSKVYERLIFRQLSKFIDDNKLLSSTISAYRKGQSTTTVMQAIRDDITKAMSRGEVTMMIFADFSKAFDTIRFKNLISKMSKLGFCKDFLTWTLNYVSHRKHFDVEVYAAYMDRAGKMKNSISISFELDADTLVEDAGKKRVRFETSQSPSLLVKDKSVLEGTKTSIFKAKAYLRVDECPDCEDKINPYPDIQLKVVAKVPEGRPAPPTPATSGNAPSLQPYFVLPYSTGEANVKNYTETKIQVKRACDPCKPNLMIKNIGTTKIPVQAKDIKLNVQVGNTADQAFGVSLTVHLPSPLSVRLCGTDDVGCLFGSPKCEFPNNNSRIMICDLGNFAKTTEDYTIKLDTSEASNSLQTYLVTMNVTSKNKEDASLQGDNSLSLELNVASEANIEMRSVSKPEGRLYGGSVRGQYSMTKEDQIGLIVDHTYT